MKQTMNSAGKALFLSGLLFPVLWVSCSRGDHFISDQAYRLKVEQQFEQQALLARHRADTLFGVFDRDLTLQEREALQFLYAYMSLNDLADYNGDFFLQNVRSSLAARDTFSWGRRVPEELFRHFVLPVRVNNENLDSSRRVFFMELKDRVKGLSMRDAALEVNHWCHEKVIYRSTDGRTSSPLATVKTAFGRCGEESTFTTAAMRAVGIPARQCYTPRWAHGDDNHAWVEVWIDSAWHYLGACEPEPDLDMAWFTAPAKRAMLVNTNVFGDYTGPEDVLLKEELFTRINILPNYASTKRMWARVLDIQQQPVKNATVEFQLYNYAEFYPLLKSSTNDSGLVSLLTGYGDLLIWAAKGELYGFSHADVRKSDTVTIYLEITTGVTGGMNFDLVPPLPVETVDQVNDSLKALNTIRLKREDAIREAYEATFIDSVRAWRVAANLNQDPAELWKYLNASRGNSRAIIAFLAEIPDSLKHLGLPLLQTVSEKDLRDADPVVLTGSINHYATLSQYLKQNHPDLSRDLLIGYILNPRIDNELLKPYHRYVYDRFDRDFIDRARQDPNVLADWIRSQIMIDSVSNYSRAPLTPMGVFDLRVSDPHSRNLFFVAACRSFGIPARLEPATRIPQFYLNGTWNDIFFEDVPEEPERNATLSLWNDPGNKIKPEYYIHYTVEHYKEGFFRTLDYENSELVRDFPVDLKLIPGTYLVVSGNRLSDGTVLARMIQVNLEAGKTTKLPVTLRQGFKPPPVFGSFEKEQLALDLKASGLPSEVTRGVVLAWIEPGKEPTNHFLSDLKKKASEISAWKGSLILFLPNVESLTSFRERELTGLPVETASGLFSDYPFDRLYRSLDIPLSGKLPVVIFINPDGIINYFSEGYRIGIGEELVKLMGK